MRIFPAVYFVNTNPPDERVQVLLSKEEPSKLPDKNPNIFKKSNIDRYMERSNSRLCNGRHSILDDFCYAKFLPYCTLKKNSSKTCKYQPNELNHNLIENKHEDCSYQPSFSPSKKRENNTLMISGETMRCRQAR